MRLTRRFTLVLAGTLALAGCNDFLTGGDLSNDPTSPSIATNRQLFVGVSSNTWSILGGDPARITGLLTQQFEGQQSQYLSAYQYSINEQTTNGAHTSLYAGGGLKDVRQLQQNSIAQGDTLFLGIAQIQEALLIGTGADLFGDLVYTQALKGTPNPALDKQLAIYDSMQTLLSRGIANLAAYRGTATNLGPAASDLNYGGDRNAWTRLAHTLKARFYLHTAEVRPAAYLQALDEARLGITDPDQDYKAIFSGAAGEENLYYQFTLVQRFGYLVPNAQYVDRLEARNDPRIEEYFDTTGDVCGVPFYCLAYYGDGSGRGEESFDQPLVTSAENLLIWAEAAQRQGRNDEARTSLNEEKQNAGVALSPTTLTGTALLREILDEKYLALFESIEVFNDYKRTCWPNLTPTVPGVKIPARLLYDAGERQTNSSVPGAQSQPTRNQNDPPNATDITGAVCRGQ